jgi:hypothetical protein
VRTTNQAAYLAELRKPRDYPAVSVLLPTHRHLPENQQDPIRLRNLIGEARRRLAADPAVSGHVAATVMSGLEHAADEVDLVHAADGLALFASATDASAHQLAHPVAARVEVGGSYATRDLVADAVRAERYYALVLSEKPTRLWAGWNEHLTEVTTDGFPITHLRPGGESALPGGYGKRRSAHRDERHRQHFRDVDLALAQVRARDRRPVIVLAVDRYQAFFDEVSDQLDAVIGRVWGSFDSAGAAQVAELVAPVLDGEVRRRQEEALDQLSEARGANRYAGGLTEVWDLARQGRGALLIVEQGYRRRARLDEGDGAPEVFDDAVDEVVETVLDDGGEVVFVPDGALAEQERIALVLRY